MEAGKNRLLSPRRAKEKPNQREQGQTIDFSIFRRKNSESVMDLGEGSISVTTKNVGISVILACIHFMYNKTEIDQGLFKQLQIINIPRQYQQYLSDRTVHQMIKLLQSRFNSLTAISDVLNHYPIAIFLLELFARQTSLAYLHELSDQDNELMMGNEFGVLNQIGCDIRGNALDIMTKSLQLSAKFKIEQIQTTKFMRKSTINQCDQNYGYEDYCAAVDIKRNGKEFIFTVTDYKTNYSPKLKKSKIELLQRKSRVKSPEGRTIAESRSIFKDKKCDECGKIACQCKKLATSEVSDKLSPTNQSKSITAGFAQYAAKSEGLVAAGQLNAQLNSIGGFINVNKIVNRQFFKRG